MKKSIATKIEKLLKSLAFTDSTRVINSETARRRAEKNALEPDNLHYELNPDKPSFKKLPARLLELLRPRRNPAFNK